MHDPTRAPRDAETDLWMMRHALALGARGLGRTWPNPAVGAVLWRTTPDGPRIVGRGWTAPGGRPHAETGALAEAGEATRGAGLAVTLEPCAHHGRTPPCADAIRAAGVARVVSAMEDPDPRVAGRGHALLRAAGIAVAVGVCAAEAREAHLGHALRVAAGRPLLTLKLARTPDGFAARREGPRLLVTGEAANARVHRMRAEHDAVLVGLGTVLADDPLLTCRLPGLWDRSPVRVVLDRELRTPPAARLVRTAREVPTWIVAGREAPPDREAALRLAGVEVLRLAGDGRGRLPEALARLAGRGVTRVLCEGGPRLAEALALAGLIDRVVLLTGPAALGVDGVPALGTALAADIADPARFAPCEAGRLGPDRIETFARLPCSPAS